MKVEITTAIVFGSDNSATIEKTTFASLSSAWVTKGNLSGNNGSGDGPACANFQSGTVYISGTSTGTNIDFWNSASDTGNTVAKGALNHNSETAAGAENDVGFLVMAGVPTKNTGVDQLIFASDATSAVAKTALNTPRGGCAGTGI